MYIYIYILSYILHLYNIDHILQDLKFEDPQSISRQKESFAQLCQEVPSLSERFRRLRRAFTEPHVDSGTELYEPGKLSRGTREVFWMERLGPQWLMNHQIL